MRVLRGVVYMTKSSGPRTEPCSLIRCVCYSALTAYCVLTSKFIKQTGSYTAE